MQYKILFLFTFFMAFGQIVIGQTVNENDTSKLPEIVYSNANPKYEIAEITITGADNYEDFLLIGFSGLSVGDIVSVPGEAISKAVKLFMRQGLFSDVKIYATKIADGKVWLNISLKERPRVSEINFKGLKKGEIEDLEVKLGIVKGNQITPNISEGQKSD